MSSLLRLEQQQKIFLKIHFELAYFSFFLTHLELKQQIRSYNPVAPLKTIPGSRPKRRKDPTFWGGTYLYGLYRGVTPGCEMLFIFALRECLNTGTPINRRGGRPTGSTPNSEARQPEITF